MTPEAATDLAEQRRRQHEENHTRSPELQTLDALLRIEETLEKLRVDFLRTRREQIVEDKVADKPKTLGSTKLEAKAARKVDRL